jgi:hypothetical protein
MQSDALGATRVSTPIALSPAAAVHGRIRNRMLRSETPVVESLGDRVVVIKGKERSFRDLVVSLDPKGAPARPALASAPAGVCQW